MRCEREVNPIGMLNNYKTKRRVWAIFRKGKNRRQTLLNWVRADCLYIMNMFFAINGKKGSVIQDQVRVESTM